jgi:hydroxyacylglutathione hydrolase
MVFRQILNEDLGCASYLVGDGGLGAVIDPRWDIDVYVRQAESDGVQIVAVLDTHLHADHVSGRERLAARTGARAYAPRGSDHAAPPLDDGAVLRLGRLELRVLDTPGHRPEHRSLVLVDRSRGEAPWLVMTGDSLLVGDLARPDLAVEAHEGAADLRRSLDRLLELGDEVEVWPGHVGGSLCGGSGLSGKTSSTVGFERRHQALLSANGNFAEELLRELPARPPNLERIVARNRGAAAVEPQPARELGTDELGALLEEGVRVLDERSPDDFDTGHLAGAVNLPPGGSRGTRAGWVLDPEEPVIAVATSVERARDLAEALHAVGIWQVLGVVAARPRDWKDAGLPVRSAGSWDVATLADGLRSGAVRLVDVREPGEWEGGHVPGSLSLPLAKLGQAPAAELAVNDGPVVVACAAGGRAAFAASQIRRLTNSDVYRVAGGGIADLAGHGVTLESGN